MVLADLIMPRSVICASAQEREQEEGIRIEPGAFTQKAGLLQELLRPRAVAAIQVDGRQAVVAREDELRLSDPLRQRQRLAIRGLRFLQLAAALMDLRHHDERNGEVIQLAELAVERDGVLAASRPSVSQRSVSAQYAAARLA